MADNDSVSGRLAKIAGGGGQIPRKASPSGGRKVDDVKARLSPGEFVIPKAAVAARGPDYWASQELAARGKPVSSESVASAVYAPKHGGAQRFDEGGESGDSGWGGYGSASNSKGTVSIGTPGQGYGGGEVGGDVGQSYGFGAGASGFSPSGIGQGVGGTGKGTNTAGGWGSVGYGGSGFGGGSGGSGVGQGNASAGGGSTGSYGGAGGGGGASGGGGSTGSYGGAGGASAGSAGGTSGGGHGGVYGMLGIDPRSVAYGPGVTPSQGGMYGGVSNFGSGLGFGSSPSLSTADAMALVRAATQPRSTLNTNGVSVPSSLTGSPIGQAASIGVPSSLTGSPNPLLSAEDAMAMVKAASIPGIAGSPIGQAASIGVPNLGQANAFALSPNAGVPANLGQPATRGVNALAPYGIGPTMGVGMPGSAGRASPTIASLVGPRGVSAPAAAVGQQANAGRGGYALQPVFGNRGGR